MADDKKAHEAELAKLKAENAELAAAAAELKKVKADNAAQASQLKAAGEQNQKLEAELMKALEAGEAAPRGGPEELIRTLVAGQTKLTEAVQLLVEQKKGPHEPRKSDKREPLPEKYKGKKYYLRTKPGYTKGKYFEPGTIKILVDKVPGQSDIPCNANGTPTGEPRRDGRPIKVGETVLEPVEVDDEGNPTARPPVSQASAGGRKPARVNDAEV